MVTALIPVHHGLEDLLLKERIEVSMAVVPGATFHPISSEIGPVPALAIVNSRTPDFRGIRTGRRSSIVELPDFEWPVKYKGARIEKALRGRRAYRIPRGAAPYYGLTLGNAELDVEITANANEIREGNGFRIGFRPLGHIDYKIEFEPNFLGFAQGVMYDMRHRWRAHPVILANLLPPYVPLTYIALWREHLREYGRIKAIMGAAVTEVKGNLRVQDLVKSPIKDQALAEEVCHQIALSHGAQNKLLKNAGFQKHPQDAHLENVALFSENGWVYVNELDFDASDWDASGQSKVDPAIEKKRVIAQAQLSQNLRDFLKRVPALEPVIAAYRRGAKRGYENPDLPEARQPILLEELKAAFAF